MSFSLDGFWIWDLWVADDGEQFHLYYLHAPKSLGDQELRHRNARVGHAVSTDLISWRDLGPVLGPGAPGAFDETATWTGSVVRGPDGAWRMFYTGSRFLDPGAAANIETIGVATSADLHTWTKAPGPVVVADPEWYETLDDGTWREEAWRDPWVFADPHGDGWHMLITARTKGAANDDRGVVGHAWSSDLATWTVRAPLSEPGAGFAHLEVLQLSEWDGRLLLSFSCDRAALAGRRTGDDGGIWAVAAESATGPFRIEDAQLVADQSLYAGRIVTDRSGAKVLLAFENETPGGGFGGRIADPVPLHWAAGAALPAVGVRA